MVIVSMLIDCLVKHMVIYLTSNCVQINNYSSVMVYIVLYNAIRSTIAVAVREEATYWAIKPHNK